jgi:hypothetical protein
VSQDLTTETTLRRYLLAALPDDQREQIEAAYLSNDGAFEQLQIAEDDLIDAYVYGDLDAEDRERFEHAFLTSQRRRERLALASALRREAEAAGLSAPAARAAGQLDDVGSSWASRLVGWVSAPSVPRWAFLSAALAVVATASWLGLRELQLRESIGRLQTDRSRLAQETVSLRERLEAESRRADSLASRLERAAAAQPGAQAASPSSSLIASFLLSPGLVRGASNRNAVQLTGDTALVRLLLELDSDSHPRYRPVLETASGDEVWRARPLAARSSGNGSVIVTLDLPSTLLTDGDYVLTLSGIAANGRSDDVADYAFRVTRP